jgi:hypothetical protein
VSRQFVLEPRVLREEALGAPASALHDIIERERYPISEVRQTTAAVLRTCRFRKLAAAERVDDAAGAQRIRNSLQQAGTAMPAISQHGHRWSPMRQPVRCSNHATTCN